jgi:hypothetical protein
MTSPLQIAVTWTPTESAEYPFTAEVNGEAWVLRLGDFPAEPLYTLLVDGTEVASFDTWPGAWTRPSAPRA